MPLALVSIPRHGAVNLHPAPLPIALLAVPVTYVVTHYILTSGPDRAQGAGDGAGLPGNRSQGLGSRFRTRSPGNR